MRVLHSYDEAFNISKPYVNRNIIYKESVYLALSGRDMDQVPREATLPIWKMTEEALANTLRYVFEKLHHNCYLLCVKEQKPIMYKLESSDTAPTFKKAIENGVSNLDKNPHIDESQRKYIRSLVSNPVRVMQCIVKKYERHSELPEENEYMELLETMLLPDGVYLMNLSDAIILHSKGKEPFQMVTGNRALEPEFQFDSHIPIMSMSGQKKYSDIPIPNYDDLLFILGKREELKTEKFVVDWDKKTIQKAVFRGGSTGCGYTTETNMRIKLADMESPLIDAALTSKGKTINTMAVKFDPKYGIGMMNTKIRPATKFLSMIEQSQYKYIIHVDGNVNAYRLLTTMLTGSLILRVDSPYTSWVDHLLKPNKHYIMVKPDMSDLVDKIKWCIKHDTKSSQIARNGYEFAKQALTMDYIKTAFENIFWTVSPLPPKPRSPLDSPPKRTSEEGMEEPSDKEEPLDKEEPSDKEEPLDKEEPSDKEEQSDSVIQMPENAKKCPSGFISHTIKDKNDKNFGKKMCKRKTQKKIVNSSSGSVIDIPENAKKCPKGFVSYTDKKDGKKKCKRKTQKKE